ncbi:kelch repeat protein [Pyronema omphalodes]|nr:kelch repeat protein [Pyronema omphalodes]
MADRFLISLLLLLVFSAFTSGIRLERRDDSPTDVCARWSHQTAVVNGKIYIYGGQAKKQAGQKSNTWNNNFLTLDLTGDWDVGSPKLKGLPIPSGPPSVANGYLWHNYDKLFLYGGLFSDSPVTLPPPFELWQYDIKGGKWSTSDYSVSDDSGSKEIQRAAEGAGVSVPGRSLGFYFSGHLDGYTTEGWSQSIARVYLKSLLEFDMDKKQFRNITKNGLEKFSVPERADGVLVFVPWGKEGILLAIGGGNNETFSQMNIIDVYDVATKQWTKQSTDGPTPQYRVNPCAVVTSAPDGSSHNIYFFGGQNLVPYLSQKQYDDMYILTVPAFKWIQVDQANQPVPPARAGHTCDLVGSQLIVIGGYTGPDLSCDAPGFYVFDVSSLKWKTAYSSAMGGFPVDNGKNKNTYRVPQAVVDVVGGNPGGGAKVTKPLRVADPNSPIITADSKDYKYTTFVLGPTIAVSTAPDGTVTTSTIMPSADGPGPNIGAIVGGVVGGIFFIVGLVFAGAWVLYKRKIKELRAAAAKVGTPAYSTKERGSMGTDLPGGFTRQSNGSSTDLNELHGEPTFWGVLLSPRRSLRVVNS